MKKTLLLLLLALLAPPAFSRDFTYEYEGQTITYTVLDEEAKTCETKAGNYDLNSGFYTPGNSVSGILNIPTIVYDEYKVAYTVTSVGNYAFASCSSLKEINIPESVSRIGGSAFYDCQELQRAEFSSIESLCDIDFENQFSNPLFYAHRLFIANNEITELRIPNSVSVIRDNTFYGFSEMTSLIIPNSVVSIGKYAFFGCKGLKYIEVPSSVISIGTGAFQACTSLNTAIIYSSVVSISERTFQACTSLTTIQLPNCIKDIGIRAFAGCRSLATLVIPNSVTSIGKSAFLDCSGLTSIRIPNSVTTIEDETFYGCSGLKSINIPDSVTVIGGSAFDNCSNLSTVVLGNSVESIGRYSFYGCPIKSLYTTTPIPLSTSYSFSNFSGTLYVQGSQDVLNAYKNSSYEWSKFNSIQMGIPATGFDYDGDDHIYAHPGDSFKMIASLLPNNASLPNIIWSSSDEAVATVDAEGCVTIQNDDVRNGANECKILGSTFYNDGPTLEVTVKVVDGNNTFEASSDGQTLNYTVIDEERGYVETKNGDSETPGNAVTGELKIPGAVTYNGKTYQVRRIGSYGFANCTALTSVTIADGVEQIGQSAFEGCSKIKELTIGKDVKNIGDKAFYGAITATGKINFAEDAKLAIIGDHAFENLRIRGELFLPNSVKIIGDRAFAYARMLDHIELPANENLVIGENAFMSCQRLTDLEFPTTIKSIGAHAFIDLPEITELNIKANNIGEEAFANSTTTKLAKVSVEGNGNMGKCCFKGQTALEEATVNIPVIGESVFADLSNLKQVNFGEKIESIEPYAFSNCAMESLEFPVVETPEAVIVVNEGAFVGNPVKNLSLGNRMKKLWNANISCEGTVDLGSTVETIYDESTSWVIPTTLTLPSSLELILQYFNVPTLNIPSSDKKLTIEYKSYSRRPIIRNLNVDRQYDFIWFDGQIGGPGSGLSLDSLICGETPNAGLTIDPYKINSVKYAQIGGAVKSLDLKVTKEVTFSDGIEEIVNLNYSGEQSTIKFPASLKKLQSLTSPKITQLIFADGTEPLAIKSLANISNVSEIYLGRDIDKWDGESFTFVGPKLNNVVIGDKVTSISDGLFKNCSTITNVVMSDNVSSIGSEAFLGCSGLDVLALSENMKTIGDNAYSGCTNIQRIVARGTVPATGNAGFGREVEDNVPLYVPDEAMDDYMDSDLFYPFMNIEGFNNNITEEVGIDGNIDPEFTLGSQFCIFDYIRFIIKYFGDKLNPKSAADMRRVMTRAASDNALSNQFYWFSPNPEIATVDQDGMVTINQEGATEIWAYVLDGSDRKAVIKIGKDVAAIVIDGDFNNDGVT
ncbi:MAG: leucine-rich repeat protein, partial [Muribaculaceae bacterium]|nr:leucine-rich repeat protein [Muribaculaceae bacterium]